MENQEIQEAQQLEERPQSQSPEQRRSNSPQQRPKSALSKRNQQKKIQKNQNQNSNQKLDLRHKFQLLLQKLDSNDTKSNSFGEIQKLFTIYNNTSSLKIFLSCLSENQNSIIGQEMQSYVIGLMAKQYGDQVIDQKEQNQGQFKYLEKMNNLLRKNLQIDNDQVQLASAKAYCDTFINCFPKQDHLQSVSYYYNPLIQIINSGIFSSQNGATLAIFEFIKALSFNKNEYENTLQVIYKRIVSMFLKIKMDELFNIISSIGLLIEICGFDSLIPQLEQTRVETCKLFTLIGKEIQNKTGLDIQKMTPKELQNQLLALSSDRVKIVQTSAKEAKIIWFKLLGIQNKEEVDQQNPQQKQKKSKSPQKYSQQLKNLSGFEILKKTYELQKPQIPLSKNDMLQQMREQLKKEKNQQRENSPNAIMQQQQEQISAIEQRLRG